MKRTIISKFSALSDVFRFYSGLSSVTGQSDAVMQYAEFRCDSFPRFMVVGTAPMMAQGASWPAADCERARVVPECLFVPTNLLFTPGTWLTFLAP